jgi:protein DGCR14
MAEGSKALERKRNMEIAQMGPPPLPKKIKRPATVLDEKTYLSGLSHIIARDYFPGIFETQLQHEFLDALESKDDMWIQDSSARLTQMMTPGGSNPGRRGTGFGSRYAAADTPRGWAGATPIGTDTLVDEDEWAAANGEKEKKAEVDLNLSLGAFQAKYTSEDNESFYSMLDKQNTVNREKHAHLWTKSGMKPSARLLLQQEREQKLLEGRKSSDDSIVPYYSRRDERPAMPNFKKSAPLNSFMFDPDGIEDSLISAAQDAQAKSLAPPKSIVHSNTRIDSGALEPNTTIPASPSMSAINDAIAGRPHLSASEAGWETPRVDGYAFVDAEPTAAEMRAFRAPQPDSGSTSSSSSANTQALLARIAGDKTSNPFTIKESTSREKLAHKLVDKKMEKLRGKAPEGVFTPGGKTPTPKFLSAPRGVKTGALTPAGKRLLENVRTPAPKFGGFSGETNPSAALTPVVKKDKKLALTPRH